MSRSRARRCDLLRDVDWLELAGEAADGLTAVETINSLKPDLVFLDVNLPEFSGLEAPRRLLVEPLVVFITAHDEHAITAFELAAIDHLLKPFGRQRFTRAIVRARDAPERKGDRPALADARDALAASKFVRVHRSHVVNLDFVEALEACCNAPWRVRMRDGEKIISSRLASKHLRELAI